MKRLIFILVITVFCFSCRKDHDCYVVNSSGEKIDPIVSIPCNCYKQTISDLEESKYITDTADYQIECFQN